MGTEERYEFDDVKLLCPFAVGVPGKRTFFLGMGQKDNWLRIWLEKEHLEALAIGIEQLISTLSQEQNKLPREAGARSPADDRPSGLPSAELDIVQMNLGYEGGKAIIEVLAQRTGSREKNPTEVHCRVTLAQLKRLGSAAARVCAAGRPLCPICGGPIDPTGHICPETN
jgi:uncharacterized repeat protein (TIGR03847 family)